MPWGAGKTGQHPEGPDRTLAQPMTTTDVPSGSKEMKNCLDGW